MREADREILAELDRGFTIVGHNIANCHFKDGINAAMAVARAANRYFDEQAPWKQIKVDRDAAGTTIYVMLQVISGLRVLFLCPGEYYAPCTCTIVPKIGRAGRDIKIIPPHFSIFWLSTFHSLLCYTSSIASPACSLRETFLVEKRWVHVVSLDHVFCYVAV